MTVFLAIVYLSLIVFSCSLVEMTRINIAKVQAQRSMISASQSVMGAYDGYLKDQYGIFARDEGYADLAFLDVVEPNVAQALKINSGSGSEGGSESGAEMDYAYYVMHHIRNNPNDLRQSLMDATLFEKVQKSYWDFYQMSLKGLVIKEGTPLVDQKLNDVSYVKEDMLEWMNLRVPMLLLEPFLKKVEAYEKVGKTGTFIKEKNQLIEEAATIEGSYVDLYRWIEGIAVDENTGAMTKVDGLYVKGLTTTLEKSLYDPNYFDGCQVEEALETGAVYMDQVVADYRVCLGKFPEYLERVESCEQNYHVLAVVVERYRTQVVFLEERLEGLEAEAETKTEAETEVDEVELEADLVADARHTIIGTRELLALAEEDLVEVGEALVVAKSQFEGLRKESMVYYEGVVSLTQGSESYLEVNRQALNIALVMQSEMEDLRDDVSVFVEEKSLHCEDYIEETYEQSVADLEEVSQSYDTSYNYDVVNNLGYMSEELEKNVDLLEGLQDKVEFVMSSYESLVLAEAYDLEGAKARDVEGDSESDSEGEIAAKEAYLDVLTLHKEALTSISEEMSAYSREMYFDYSLYSDYSSQAQEASQGLLERLKGLAGAMDFTKVFEDLPPTEVALLSGHPSSWYSDAGGSGDSDVDFDMAVDIRQAGIDFRELIFLNEYAVGMFCAYPDKGDESQLTLSGQAKASHVLDTEVEYILTGKETSSEALKTVLLMIFGVRVVCNSIYLLTDSVKRTTIMNLANTIAGWWSLGAGAIILAVIITVAWASAESMVDLMMLVNQRKVPMIKVSSTWYTSLDGNMTDLVGLGATVAEKTAVKIIDVAAGEVSQLVTDVGGLISEESSQFYTEEIGRVYEEGCNVLAVRASAIEKQFYGSIDAYLDQCRNGSVSQWRCGDYFDSGTAEYKVMEDIVQALAEALDGHYDQNSLISARKVVTDMYGDTISYHKEQSLLDWTMNFDQKVVEYAGDVNLEIERYAASGKEAAGDMIHKKSEAFLKSIHENVAGDLGAGQGLGGGSAMADGGLGDEMGTGASGDQGAGLAEMVPSLGYHDYLRVFMLIDGKGLDERVYRMLDLIELNMAYAHSDRGADGLPSKRLSDYVVGLEAEGTFEMEFGLFLMPLIQYRDQSKDGSYKFKVTMANGY